MAALAGKGGRRLGTVRPNAGNGVRERWWACEVRAQMVMLGEGGRQPGDRVRAGRARASQGV